MARPYLVIIDTQTGPQPQIWYADGGWFGERRNKVSELAHKIHGG